MLEADFLCSTVLGALGCDRSEHLNEFDVFGLGHLIGDTVEGSVYVSGRLIGCEVGSDVGALAHGGSCALDLVAEAISAFVMFEVVRLSGFACEGVSNPLFHMLSVVAVLSGEIGCKCECRHCLDLPFLCFYLIIPYSRAFVNRFWKNFFIFLL